LIDSCQAVEATVKALRVEGKGLDTSYSTIYMSQNRDQQHFTISEQLIGMM